MSKRQDKRNKSNIAHLPPQKTGLELRHVKPLTETQKSAFESWWSGKNLLLHGTAGTGKTFVALYLALQAVLVDEAYDKVLIVRSVVPSRDMGFLPGNVKEKMKVYEAPYYSIFTELFGRGDAYDVMKQKNKVDFTSTSYARGMTLPNTLVVVDEIQNLTSSECNTIITRVGRNSKVIFAGDVRQTDLNKGREFTGLHDFMKIIARMNEFDIIEFNENDIVRSNLVRSYILARNKLEDEGAIQPLK